MSLCVPRGERLPDRRMREIRTSGGTREEGRTIPPLLYRESFYEEAMKPGVVTGEMASRDSNNGS